MRLSTKQFGIALVCAFAFFALLSRNGQRKRNSRLRGSTYVRNDMQLAEWTGTSHDPTILKQILLPNGLIPHLNGLHHSKFLPGQVVEAHKHDDMYEVFVVLSGKGTFTLNGVAEVVEKGTVIEIPPLTMHKVENTDSRETLELLYFGVY